MLRYEYIIIITSSLKQFSKVNSSVPRSGVIEWVTQGLTKVLPQPDDKYKETKDEQEEHTEVRHK